MLSPRMLFFILLESSPGHHFNIIPVWSLQILCLHSCWLIFVLGLYLLLTSWYPLPPPIHPTVIFTNINIHAFISLSLISLPLIPPRSGGQCFQSIYLLWHTNWQEIPESQSFRFVWMNILFQLLKTKGSKLKIFLW